MKALLLLTVVGASAPAFGQHCFARGGRSDQARLAFLSRELAAEAARGDTWVHAWGAIYAGLTVAQLAASPAIVEQDKIEWYVGAASSAIGVAFVVLDPLEVIDAGPVFAHRASAALDPDQVCELISEGEGLLARTAEHEARGRRWTIHAANVVLNIGLGLILGLGVGHWVAGAVNFALGVAVGEITIFTAPNRLVSAWAEYQRGALSDSAPPVTVRVVPMIRSDLAGIGLAGNF